MSIVVTGAQGFISTALIKLLSSSSDGVISLSRQDFDLPDTELQERCKGATAFIHIAGRSHQVKEPKGIEPLYQNENVLLTRRMLHLARQCGISHFLYLSSIHVNGIETKNHPFTEEDAPNPPTPYARSKLDAENCITAYCAEHNIDWTIIRSPLVYGPDAPGNIGMLQKLLHTSMPLPFGSLNNARSFISLENLCDLMAFCVHSKNARNQLYLASDGVIRSTKDLLHIMASQENLKPVLIPVPVCLLKFAARVTGLTSRLAPLWLDLEINPHKIFSQLGWRPKDIR